MPESWLSLSAVLDVEWNTQLIATTDASGDVCSLVTVIVSFSQGLAIRVGSDHNISIKLVILSATQDGDGSINFN